MPIRPENRHLYQTPEYRAACEIADKRALGRCEACRKRDGQTVSQKTGFEKPGSKIRRMFWRALARFDSDAPWVNQWGEALPLGVTPVLWDKGEPAKITRVPVVPQQP